MTRRRGPLLVVEDDLAIRQALCAILEQEGYEVWLATDGRQALDRLDRAPLPALLIVDLVMPVLSGWDLCLEMSRRPELASLPVVIISASSQLDGPLPLATARLLAKPIRFAELLAEIERFCP